MNVTKKFIFKKEGFMKGKKQKILSFISIIMAFFIALFFNLSSVYAATPYTVINSQTLLEANTLDKLVLNYTSLPKVSISGSETYTIKDGVTGDSTPKREVEFANIPKGKILNSVITVKFNNCGKLNGKAIDMKLEYSDIVAKASNPLFYWTSYRKSMASSNEWWYGNIEHATVKIYFYYLNSATPITLNTAYLSLFSEDPNEGASSKISSNQYLYTKTNMKYAATISSRYTSRTYKNVFYGVGSTLGSTEAGTLECVSFQYKNTNHIEVELYALSENASEKLHVGYHLQYGSLTASIPSNPKKVVDKTVGNPGDTLTYTITQDISKATDTNFYYSSMIVKDVLNPNLSYQSLAVYDENNKNITISAGTANYDTSSRTLKYTFLSNYLKNMKYKGQTYKFVIKAKINSKATVGSISNTASTIVNHNNTYTLNSNIVTTKLPYQVIVNHVDEKGKKLADSEILKGYEKDAYTSKAKKIQGYELTKIPSNAKGTMTQNVTTVNYVYRLKDTSVKVQYIDEKGKEITNSETIKGKVFDRYQTESKNIYGYELIKIPDNHLGTMKEEVITVTYPYRLKDSTVTVKYVDEEGKELADKEIMKGKVFDEYQTETKEIYGYQLKEKPENQAGMMREEPITVTYLYELKDARVVAQYVDEEGKELAEKETIPGKVFDQYQTQTKDIYGYQLTKTPENQAGTMKEEPTIVTYLYQLKDATVVVRYIDEEGKEITDSETIKGKVFDSYTSNAKIIKGYALIETPSNATGTMEEKKTSVVYRYRKLHFNISVSQKLAKVELNSEPQNLSEKLEIDRKVVVNSLKLTYSIHVSNHSELDGSTVLCYDIPKGYVALEEDNLGWTIEGKLAHRNVDNLVIGETREFTIILTARTSEITGVLANKVTCRDSSCEPGFEEMTLEDNTDTKEFIISISTGLKERIIEIVLEGLVVLSVLGMVLWKVRKRR